MSVYRVEPESNEHCCEQCGRPFSWVIIDPNNTRLGRTYHKMWNAYEVARLLNSAYEVGKQAVLGCSNEPSEPSKP